MKNTLKLNHTNRIIVMDRTFAKFAANTMSTEYAHLQSVRQDYPEYTVVMRKIKRNNTKECYRGLTYEYMEEYIKTHGTKEECATNLAEFKEKKLISLCHSTSRRYPVIKSWFLAKYPEVMEFGLPNDDKQTTTAGDDAATAPEAEENELEFEMPAKISA